MTKPKKLEFKISYSIVSLGQIVFKASDGREAIEAFYKLGTRELLRHSDVSRVQTAKIYPYLKEQIKKPRKSKA